MFFQTNPFTPRHANKALDEYWESVIADRENPAETLHSKKLRHLPPDSQEKQNSPKSEVPTSFLKTGISWKKMEPGIE